MNFILALLCGLGYGVIVIWILDFVEGKQRVVSEAGGGMKIIECYCHDPLNKVGAHYHVVKIKGETHGK